MSGIYFTVAVIHNESASNPAMSEELPPLSYYVQLFLILIPVLVLILIMFFKHVDFKKGTFVNNMKPGSNITGGVTLSIRENKFLFFEYSSMYLGAIIVIVIIALGAFRIRCATPLLIFLLVHLCLRCGISVQHYIRTFRSFDFKTLTYQDPDGEICHLKSRKKLKDKFINFLIFSTQCVIFEILLSIGLCGSLVLTLIKKLNVEEFFLFLINLFS